MSRRHIQAVALAATIAAAGIVWGQARGNPSEWPTAYGDAQHTSWIRNDVSISPETMSQPGFELQWKTTLESPLRRPGSEHVGTSAHQHVSTPFMGAARVEGLVAGWYASLAVFSTLGVARVKGILP